MNINHTFRNISKLNSYPYFSPPKEYNSVDWSIVIKPINIRDYLYLEIYLYCYAGSKIRNWGHEAKFGIRVIRKRGSDQMEQFCETWMRNELMGPFKSIGCRELVENYISRDTITVECAIYKVTSIPGLIPEYSEHEDTFSLKPVFCLQPQIETNCEGPTVIQESFKLRDKGHQSGKWIQQKDHLYKIDIEILKENKIVVSANYMKISRVEYIETRPDLYFCLYQFKKNRKFATPLYKFHDYQRVLYDWETLRDNYASNGIINIELHIMRIERVSNSIDFMKFTIFRPTKINIMGNVFYVNREILSDHSQFFQDFFSNNTGNDEYVIDGFDKIGFEKILSLIHPTNSEKMKVTSLVELMQLSREYKMIYLRNDCIKLIIKAPFLAKRIKLRYFDKIGMSMAKNIFDSQILEEELNYRLDISEDVDEQIQMAIELLKIVDS